MDAHTLLAFVMHKCREENLFALQHYQHSLYDPAFSLAIHQHQLMPYLAFSQAEHQVSTMHALLYAFSHPGTREAMVKLCLALFGADAQITLHESPALVDIAIAITNENFFFTLAEDHALAQDNLALADFSLENLTKNPLHFLQQFAPIGVILRQLTIAIQGNEVQPLAYYPIL